MGCGCGKGKAAGPLPMKAHQASAGPTAARVAVYEVTKGGDTVVTTSSPTTARAEAKRLGGSVRVTSRQLDPSERKELARR